jgi:plasmid replication initiation protein
MWDDGVELGDVGGGGCGEDEKIGDPRHVAGVGRGVIERSLLRSQRALGRLGGPSHHHDSVAGARLFHLTGNRAADRAEP